MNFSFAQLLDPVTPSQFRAEYYSTKPLLISNRPAKFNGLFGWEAFNAILNSSPIPHPTMRLVLGGRREAATDAIDVIDKCRNGATLVLDRVDMYDSNVAALAASISSELAEPTRINLYYSQPSKLGFNRHYDTHDVFILQILGCKSWKVFEPTTKLPLVGMDSHGLIPPEEPYLNCTLEPGDILYIPRGHWHEATAQIHQSLHLTLGIYARTGIDFLSWLVGEFRGDIKWRETFPLTYSDERAELRGPSDVIVAHFDSLRKLLISKLDDESLVGNYHRFCVASDEKRRPFAFPFQADRDEIPLSAGDTYTRPSYQRAVLEKESTGMVRLTVWGKVLTFSEAAEPAVRHIFTSPSFRPKELMGAAPELTREDIDALLRSLISEGIVIFAPRRSYAAD
jgi:ribosomal protein L16 Arg81 hydroxylase